MNAKQCEPFEPEKSYLFDRGHRYEGPDRYEPTAQCVFCRCLQGSPQGKALCTNITSQRYA